MPKKKVPGVIWDREPKGKSSKKWDRYQELLKKKNDKEKVMTLSEDNELKMLEKEKFGRRKMEKKGGKGAEAASKASGAVSRGIRRAIAKKFVGR
jgi:hypothetical protein